jgi:hypothetical protein
MHSASLLKQQSANRHGTPLGHVILIPNQPVFALSPYCCVLKGEATHINCVVFYLSRSGLKLTFYRAGDAHANHYATDAVDSRFEDTTDFLIHEFVFQPIYGKYVLKCFFRVYMI